MYCGAAKVHCWDGGGSISEIVGNPKRNGAQEHMVIFGIFDAICVGVYCDSWKI